MPGTFVNYHYSRVCQGHGLIRGHVDLIPKVIQEFHPQKRPEVADRPLQGRIRPRSAPGGSRQEKSANLHQKSKRSQLGKSGSTSQFETTGPTEEEFDELGRRLDTARQEARSVWDSILVLRRETEDLHDDCYELQAQAGAMRQEQQRIEQQIEDASQQADTLVRKSIAVRKQMPVGQRAPRSNATVHKTAHDSRSSKVSGSIHIAQLRRHLASIQEQLQSIRGHYSPRSIDAMTIAAKSWDSVRDEHEEEISQLAAQFAVRNRTYDFAKQESSKFQKMMSKRMTVVMEDKAKIMEFTSKTATVNEELREQEDVEDKYTTEFDDLLMHVAELEQSNSELKCLQEELETQTQNLHNRCKKATMNLQYDETSIVRHRRVAGEEEAAVQLLQSEISSCELQEQAQQMPDSLQDAKALCRIAEESEAWEQKRIGLEEQCQMLLFEEQEIQSRAKSEASAALSRLESHIEGQWRSELDERERIIAELGKEVLLSSSAELS
eukprot:gnl/MRDRNA2_/MRDRNA2_87963_c0_seq1.p1 gnl/MRDRNA2_/MRDRNA2_87963_c0~~gnl/MRDRNA2_/MRDRNA2_87963_c0_seq1.p1  ORF type:complete len:495 (+),score=123.65 gnl/MRDRNA2_/MRDRNA2_87963_c0_seq1:68-1552(+)